MKDIIPLLETAANSLIRNKKLPIKFLSVNQAVNGEFKFYVYFQDTKINSNQNIPNDGTFRVVFRDDITSPNTILQDISANIPSNIDFDKRIILRAAYVMFSHYQINILNVYKKVELEAKKLTLANALA